MKNRMITATVLYTTLVTVSFSNAEDKAVVVTDKSITVTKKETPTQSKTQSLSATSLIANNNVTVQANLKVIESFTIMGDSEKGQIKRQEIESKRDLASQEIQDESKKFEKAKTDYVAKSTTMSDSAREKEEKRLIKMERDIKNFVAEKEEELKLDMQIATESLAQDLEQSITQLAKNEKIDIVIDKMTGRAIYVSPEFDLTHKAIEEMNKTYKVELAQNKQAETATKVADNKAAAPKPAKVGA